MKEHSYIFLLLADNVLHSLFSCFAGLSNKGIVIGVVVGGVSLALILIVMLPLVIRRLKKLKTLGVPRGKQLEMSLNSAN